MEEITIKVPAPFSGVSDLGFTARYPSQDPYSAPPDVPFLIEGPPQPMRRLLEHLRLLRRDSGRAYSWTDPVMLSDQVLVMAFRDRSLERDGRLDAGTETSRDYLQNAVRPVVFPFLQDCATVAGLRLEDPIEIRVQASRQVAELRLRLEQIVQPNGHDLLWSF
jgi:hypothetical protein